MKKQSSKQARQGVWRMRRVRFSASVNVLIALLLAGVIVATLNYLAAQHPLRWYLSSNDYYRLSEKTLSLMKALEAEVNVVAFLNPDSATSEAIKRLLREYDHAAEGVDGLAFRVEFVDPGRDVGRTRELADRYGVSESDMIVFESGVRRKYIRAQDTMEKQRQIDLQNSQVVERTVAFHGETLFTSALMSVAREDRPTVYFLKGHGERGIEEYGSTSGGYSQIATILARDNVVVKPLLLIEEGIVPDDCAALVIPGPRRKLAQREIDALQLYLERSGRVFLLLDAGAETGLEGLLESWGCRIGRNVTATALRTAFMSEGMVAVKSFTQHPVTRHLAGMAITLYRPRPIEAFQQGGSAAPDKPRVTVLATSDEKSWIEADLKQRPPRFDEGEDSPGPVPLAVAIEKGPGDPSDMEIRPTQLVVLGDASLVSNGSLSRGVGGNRDLFMGAMNWLLERDELVPIAPRPPNVLQLRMSDSQTNKAFLIMVVAIPGGVALLGVFVWLMRRG